jgi:hypothetical protein
MRNPFPTHPAESPAHIVWMDFADSGTRSEIAENGPILRSFLPVRCTGSNGEDCYTFERFAPIPGEIHTYYYYHYKRKRFGLKEETTWS